MEGRQLLAIVVTTSADSGAGSLRQAIIDANASPNPTTIDFQIGSGQVSILPITPLPALANSITIDGTSQPGYKGTPIVQISGSQIDLPITHSTESDGLLIQAGNCTIQGLVINLFNGNGIEIRGGGKNVIAGNYMGTDLSGEISFPNIGDGIYTVNSRNNLIGGPSVADRNLISGNGGGGIDILSSGSNIVGGNVIQGNFIGTDITGLGALGNTYDGITLNSTSTNIVGGTAPGAGNTIAFNGGDGVKVGNYYDFGGQQLYNTILSNSITGNGNLGINLLFGGNDPVDSAVVSSAYPSSNGQTTVEGSFFATPGSTYSLQFFSNLVANYSGAGEGQTLVGSASVTTDSNGYAQFTSTLPVAINPGNLLSATATSPAGSTSSFFKDGLVTSKAVANLSVSQYEDNTQVASGSPLNYTILVTNNGPSRANNVTLTDTLPVGVALGTITTTSGTFTQSNGTITFQLGTLESNASVSITIEVTPTLLDKLTNSVVVQGTPTDSSPDDNTSVIMASVVPNPNPPTVTDVRPVVGLHSISAVVVTFSVPLDPAQAVSPINYRVVAANARGKFTRVVPLHAPVYDPDNLTITLTPRSPYKLGTLYELQIDGQGAAGVTDLGGNLLVGNTADGPLGAYFMQFSRGYVSPRVSGIHPGHVSARSLRR